ncbi:uncharacterized protein DMENIID0001_075520 [Sergentomyia squamirostris]
MDEPPIATLHRRRGAIKTNLLKLRTKLLKIDDTTNITADVITVYEQQLDNYCRKFDDVQKTIYDHSEIDDDDFTTEQDEETAFEEATVELRIKIKDILRAVSTSNAANTPEIKTSQLSSTELSKILEEQLKLNSAMADSLTKLNKPRTSHIKLPELNIPPFTGKYSEWASFKDLFTCTIHNNESLSGVRKLQYLKSFLRDEAESLIKLLPITEENYEVAWKLVTERFEKKQSIISEHIQAYLDVPPPGDMDDKALRHMLNVSHEVPNALDALSCSSRDVWLVHILVNKLGNQTKLLWAQETPSGQVATLEDFRKFLEKRCDALETVKFKPSEKVNNKSDKPAPKNVQKKTSLAATENAKCGICSQSTHRTFQCSRLVNATPTQRLEIIRKQKLCINCMKSSHTVESCSSTSCRRCQMRHNTLLHEAFNSHAPASGTMGSTQTRGRDTAASSAPAPAGSQNPASVHTGNTAVPASGHAFQSGTTAVPAMTHSSTTEHSEALTVAHSLANQPRVRHHSILPTISLFVIDQDGEKHACRALLDSGSQPNFITRNIINKIRAPTYIKSNHIIAGIGNQESAVTKAAKLTINSRDHTFATTCEFLVMDKITDNQPNRNLSCVLKTPQSISLADPDFSKPGRIDMLLGVDIFTQVIRANRIEGSPTLIETAFGYIVAGQCLTSLHVTNDTCLFSMESKDPLCDALERFFHLEEPGNDMPHLTKEEQACEEHFKANTTRLPNGRYEVSLPTRDNLNQLGDSYGIALKRYLSNEKRLLSSPEKHQQVIDFMKDYEDSQHMRELPKDYQSDQPAVYLPHHPVYKPSSKTTPVRVVFDASAKTTSGLSLNDTLMVGPKIQKDLFDHHIHFREHRTALKADHRQMFRQIPVKAEDQNLQRILFRQSPNEPIKTYLLSTVTYGTACASFLAVRVVQQTAIDEGDAFPIARDPALEDFFMDDFISGAASPEEAREPRVQMTELMRRGGFHMSKWLSNDPAALEGVPEKDLEISTLDDLCADSSIKALGVLWNPTHDIFTFSATKHTQKITKRNLLSEISRIFDPLGLIAPVVISAKVLMKQLWLIKADWDDDLSGNEYISTTWKNYQDVINDVPKIQIPRRFTTLKLPVQNHLLLFCDASEKAFAACIYVKTIDEYGQTQCQLLTAKSKVAPHKKISIARLELCAAVLGVRLLQTVLKALKSKISSITGYSDSTIVLHWLAAEPYRWKTFVANRVTEIQQILSTEHWHHVSSENNPADVASRGTNPTELSRHTLWWKGPDLDVIQGSETPELSNSDEEVMERRVTCAMMTNTTLTNVLEKFTTYSKMIKGLTVFRRFFQFLKSKVSKVPPDFGPITVSELNETRNIIIRSIQHQFFHHEIHQLQKGKPIDNESKILRLNPFLDEKEILRVGGRIQASHLPPERKHPILLPAKHYLTQLIADDTHIRLTCHGGPREILTTMRQTYWPIRGIDVAKAAFRKCIKCFRVSIPKKAQQMMGNLPPARVQLAHPFQRVGVDFCGPFHIKLPLRNARTTKMYVAVFVCFITRAIHLELVSDLTAEAFLAAFRRFVARRGKCSDCFCDNAGNFAAGASRIQEIQQSLSKKQTKDEIINGTASEGITFHFIPPRSPHFGGLWETAVKSFKTHFYRIAGKDNFTQEAFTTLLADVEACLNSRPLTPLSTDPGDLETLTPGHYLIGRPLNAIPEHDVTDLPVNSLKYWRRLEQYKQHFWKRWSREILSNMQSRPKWKHPHPNLQIGDLVLLVEDNLPPLSWVPGRVIELHTGNDGHIRVVVVRTAWGVYKRAIQKIAPFPPEVVESLTRNTEGDTSAAGSMAADDQSAANAVSGEP